MLDHRRDVRIVYNSLSYNDITRSLSTCKVHALVLEKRLFELVSIDITNLNIISYIMFRPLSVKSATMLSRI